MPLVHFDTSAKTVMLKQFALRGTWQGFGWGHQGSSPDALAVFSPGAEWLKVLG